MPSFRVTVTISALRPGVAPESVLPFAADAADAAARSAVVEASDLAIVRGAPRIVVRYTVDDVGQGWRVGADVVEALAAVVHAGAWTVTVRDGSRWYPVHGPGPESTDHQR